jgi:DNA-binding CsgD family transcriptional regulator
MHGGLNPERREELRRQAREQLGPARARAAEERGAAMSLATATEYALLLAAEPVRLSGDGASVAGNGTSALGDGVSALGDGVSGLGHGVSGLGDGVSAGGDGASLPGDGGSRSGVTADGTALARLSPRERELVTLVARGHTDAQIAGQLYITVRTVSSHLDRVRDKTGCRRRADLTRLALSAGLV